MALSLRRSLISSRYLLSALRASSMGSPPDLPSFIIPHIISSAQSSVDNASSINASATVTCQYQFHRNFSRGRKQMIRDEKEEEEDEQEDGTEEEEEPDDDNSTENADVSSTIKAAAVMQMEAAVDALSRELTKLRTGRASEGILDHVLVEYYGVKTPLNRMAAVSVVDPKTLKVTPYDISALKELEKAIISSPLGLNPNSDSQQLIIPIPPLTKEHMQAVCKVVAKSSEDVKQSIRRSRQKAFDSIRKVVPTKKDKEKGSSSISEDDAKRLEKEIDELTKKFIKKAEDMCKTKEKEIRG